ncbi:MULTISPECIES: ABC transporter ATP-binding protein [Lactobacillus]|uniref:ABC transporter ATP-binding protein n=1 Tax=Lactobacillus paragasseri TaxID=2107999 RepID=A0AAW6XNN3_9LACO|nr:MULTISPECIES: ABC transporter ATP-binding protein [Lactobacillus]MCQ5245381.1 ABC transporter ATP-binding protein [Lactobacillus gasseri]MCZ3508652.1 ABC transporter ATP-binding protein [Lactobacillus gasseri]MDK6869386.1 ABC transporter ATP-binding protein [Lactobacillus paragasseri]OOK87277.1 ABC transporter ATP-binding protein [Lactobacillus gasseri]TVU98942.1 ABC transporter ATP-binding protein [Lactobacillus paragasseri]
MLIETYNLTKKYGKKLALNKVNLKVDRGQLVAYLGTNGAGKSTTINILTGLLKPTSGTITYAKDLKIGVVFQNSVLDDVLSVKDNLNLRAQMYHDVSKKWLAQLIDLIGIRSFLHQKYGTLSGGRKRRVDIARALIDHPDILFLDEPTTGLDLQTRIVIWNLLQKLQKEQGLTIFLTTHYLEEAENADQMYILENGQVLANGSAYDIKDKYAPSKLVITLKEKQRLVTTYPVIERNKETEIDGLDPHEVITLLHDNQSKIKSFEYRQGSIDDAFIKIAGKELQ